ncbi:indole-3-glycerol phosphate synthase TrpC [Tuwongella immobilis]|uniref:Indole-3-glycerol phosphate synthase n=1 Tax=Tuwongella immobilis TaxID=692036 RepID=A0A6C2YNF9_9BACT|nr:indole-3-glycerol phosphate synthase TrpC [Tuwongella immobilis]VIP02595.1 indole-3-glycerol phosphate synthase : Indole-3-glycerol phosphate synthase OS=Rhodopirellula sp. SWK7 GN=trpC PE=3 SV=1: IGPS [Tuwongella immobilis]VTS01873.1 indole-3-glycerol phosphate synthase : Indole-3-glycerol phosphate synthase OS=Rhodopirellula sp. SWK7 GN=trpC PE=3 SV=1: IGPS [Tuwongella immobilis]
MPTILDEIITQKHREIETAKRTISEQALEARIENPRNELPELRDFTGQLRNAVGIGVIAEVKKASPSAGLIRADFHPQQIAQIYTQFGANCISVLTDEHFFQGNLAYLQQIREVVSTPLLRKDFIVDRYQLLEARVFGADAVLLIAECLPGDTLAMLYRQARQLGLHVLVELHDAHEVNRVVDTGAELIGVNNRDLRTFETRLEHTLTLAEQIPADRLLISESGIRTSADVMRLKAGGSRGILVGESLMRAADIGQALQQLIGPIRFPTNDAAGRADGDSGSGTGIS